MGLATANAFAGAGAAVVLADYKEDLVKAAGEPRSSWRKSPRQPTARARSGSVIGINMRGVWSSMKYELRQMQSQGSGAMR
jgi:NADP-dependent 3-hydroxy acid dehydrogenase YdfG